MHLKGTTTSSAPSRATTVALAAAAAVTALLVVTAIASREPLSREGQTVPPVGGGRAQINAPPWALALVAAGALIALLGVLAAVDWPLLRRTKRDRALRKVFRIPRRARIVALLIPTLLGALLVAAAIEGSRARTPLRPGEFVVPRSGRVPASGQASSYIPPNWLVPAVVAVVLGGGGAILLAMAYRGRLGEGPEPAPPWQVDAVLGRAVEASLEDLRSDPDPRSAVIAAYRRMETTLGDVGLPRRAWEAPREYSGRAYTYLELSAGPLRTLTALFERARFSVGRVDEPLREQAIGALVALREELRAFHSVPGP